MNLLENTTCHNYKKIPVHLIADCIVWCSNIWLLCTAMTGSLISLHPLLLSFFHCCFLQGCIFFKQLEGGGPRVVVSTAAFHARVRGSVPGLGGLKETKMFLPHPRVKVSIVGSLHDREVACSASDRQGSNFESCVWRTVSSQSSHHPQEVLLAQFSLYVHKGGLKPDSFHFIFFCPISIEPFLFYPAGALCHFGSGIVLWSQKNNFIKFFPLL